MCQCLESGFAKPPANHALLQWELPRRTIGSWWRRKCDTRSIWSFSRSPEINSWPVQCSVPGHIPYNWLLVDPSSSTQRSACRLRTCFLAPHGPQASKQQALTLSITYNFSSPSLLMQTTMTSPGRDKSTKEVLLASKDAAAATHNRSPSRQVDDAAAENSSGLQQLEADSLPRKSVLRQFWDSLGAAATSTFSVFKAAPSTWAVPLLLLLLMLGLGLWGIMLAAKTEREHAKDVAASAAAAAAHAFEVTLQQVRSSQGMAVISGTLQPEWWREVLNCL
jgi:hypothetical protein